MSDYVFEGNYAESANYLNTLITTNPLVLDPNYVEQVKAVLDYGKVGELQKLLLMYAELINQINITVSDYTETYNLNKLTGGSV